MESLSFLILPFLTVLLNNCCSAKGNTDSNQYVDTLLYISLQNQVHTHHLDPSPLNPFTSRTEERIFPSRVTIASDYGNGTLHGLSQIYRRGDCDTFNSTRGNVTIKCTLSIPHLTALYDVRVKYGRMQSVRSRVNVTFSGSLATMEVNGTRYTPYPTLHRLIMDSLGKMKIHFYGLAHLSRQQRLLRDGIIKHVPTFTLGVFYGPFAHALNAAASTTPLPIRMFY